MSRDKLTAEPQQDERERRRQRVRELREQHARAEPGDGLIRKAMGDTLPRTSATGAEPMPDNSVLVLFGDWRDKRLIDTFGATISIMRRERRAELDEALAERVVPQLKKIAALEALELKVAELRGAIDILRGAAPPPAAKFPSVKAWKEDTVYHEGDVVAFVGGTYQATKDTARAPGSQDWVCLAASGSSLSIRGTYGSAETYKHLDVAMINGSSFVALKDNPGRCPDSGNWHLLASRGSRGQRGAGGARGIMGLRGERGEAASIIQSWHVDKATYRATPVMSNGTLGPPLELRALFEQFLLETSDG